MTGAEIRAEIARFDPGVPIESAFTPPASWYVEPGFLDLERDRIFRRTWQAVGRVDQLAHGGDYLAGMLLDDPFVVVRDASGAMRAFNNVCRHHAAQVCEGTGTTSELVCPYHGWAYKLDGTLARAPGLGRSDVFDRDAFSLRPVRAEAWGPLALINFSAAAAPLAPDLAELDARLAARKTGTLRFAARRVYDMRCNWKVYVDNYLDGGYHVSALHKSLAGQLDLDTYVTEIFDRFSVQSVRAPGEAPDPTGPDFAERIGSDALYAFVYPNLMLNRYGPILDTNWVVPLGPDRTRVVFDFFFADVDGRDAAEFIERSIDASDRVQQEDVAICESVHVGLGSKAFDRGIYARVETAAYHFHRLLAADLAGADGS